MTPTLSGGCSPREPASPEQTGGTVLIVDDSRPIRGLLAASLSAAGFLAVEAANGQKALDLAKNLKFDLIICDLHMPVMDGETFRRKLLADPGLRHIPFVAMSGYGSRDNLRIMRELKAAGFLTKPFRQDQLFILIERLLSDKALIERSRRDLAVLEKKMLLSSIMSLAQALDARDGYTKSHSDSVARTGVAIGRYMGLDGSVLEQISIAGRLHDIGKIGVPDQVLQKRGRLTAEEFAIIKTHPVVGARILKPIPSLSDIADVILSHHEHFDGSGYPSGITGEKIPVLARILALADTFDAMTSNRPYRARFEPGEAIEIMAGHAGSQFCPECLEAFLGVVAQGWEATIRRDEHVQES